LAKLRAHRPDPELLPVDRDHIRTFATEQMRRMCVTVVRYSRQLIQFRQGSVPSYPQSLNVPALWRRSR
jgi:hypothetical protein